MANNKPLQFTALIQIWMTPEMAAEFVADARAAELSNSAYGRAIIDSLYQYKHSLAKVQPQTNGHTLHPEASNGRV